MPCTIGRKEDLACPPLLTEVFQLGCKDAGRKSNAEARLSAADAILPKVAIIRGNVIAHFSQSMSYNDAFRKAQLTPDELRSLTDIGLYIANVLLAERDLKPVSVWELATDDLMRMFKALKAAEELTAP